MQYTMTDYGYSNDENGIFNPVTNSYIEEPWTIIQSYFESNYLERIVRHQLESMNNWYEYQIVKTIEMFNPVHIKSETDFDEKSGKYALEVIITFSNFRLYRPQIHENNGATKMMFPQEAKLRNFTYGAASTLDLNITYIVRQGDNLENTQTFHKTLQKIHLGKLPIMTKSSMCVLKQYKYMNASQMGECKYDTGGYFIINGSEKVVLGQERSAENRVHCFNISKNEPKYTWKAEIKSIPDFKCISPKQISMMISSKNNGFGFPIYIQIPRLKQPISLFALFRALSILGDPELCDFIIQPDIFNVRDSEELIEEYSEINDYVITFLEEADCTLLLSVFTEKQIHNYLLNKAISEHKKKSIDPYLYKYFDKLQQQARRQVHCQEKLKDIDRKISDKHICEYIVNDISNEKYAKILGCLEASIIESNKYMTAVDAFQYIVNNVTYIAAPSYDRDIGILKKRQFAMDVLNNDLFPHCKTLIQKTYFLGYMTNKLLQASLGWIEMDDRDSYLNKRIDLTGTSLNNLFRNYFNKLVKDMEKQVVREIKNGSWRSKEDFINIINLTNIYKILKSTTLENGIKRALSTGDFGIKNTNSNKVGVAQVLNRLNYIGSLSHLRRISTPTDKSGKLVAPRKLHNTSWGYLCVAETPEGASVGIVKNLAYMTHITIHSESNSLYEYILPKIQLLENITFEMIDKHVKVFINGAWVGITENPITLYAQLKEMKLKGIINIYTSIVFDYGRQEIRVCNDSGRLTRPLLRVKNKNILLTRSTIEKLGKKEISWDDLLTDNVFGDAIIEYLDPEEHKFSLIATKPRDLIEQPNAHFTHCEIHPSTMFGLVASCIPFPDHNQSPRNTYQCAQAKQAMGVYATNYNERLDKTAYVLTYASRPLVDTRIMNLLKLNENPAGCNINVAIMTHTGYNQEDSLLLNKGSIDRGLLQITYLHTEKDEDKQKINGDEETRCRPDPVKTKGMKFGNYNKVNAKGLVPENTFIENRDIVIAKVTPIRENKNDHTKVIKFNDESRQVKVVEETFIDKNYVERNGDGYSFAKVRLRALRKPVIGDKFSSRHGQKGTVGNIIPEEDMPYMSNGMRPDIIINPHAIPSRMTIGQLKETLLGKVLVELGLFGDGTSFGDLSVGEISRKLLELGYEAHGNELMHNGFTGEQIECSVFIGPVFYQRLKHMVNDKAHSRSIGPMVNLTRQPAEGRSRDGGLRFGEMERDCTISHGASRFTRGRIYDASDKYAVHVCNQCGLIAAFNDKMQIHKCRTCDNRVNFSYVEIPYACKLAFQELISMNVVPRLITDSHK
jgi:DNA-directed RNA polymerase II subunit RPB2